MGLNWIAGVYNFFDWIKLFILFLREKEKEKEKEKESEFMNLWRCEYEVNMNTFLSEYEGFEGFDGIGEISKNENLVIYD